MADKQINKWLFGGKLLKAEGWHKMDLIGKVVTHAQFGVGVITQQTEQHILVKFDNRNGVTKFSFPGCFKFYLKLDDKALAEHLKSLAEETERKNLQKEQEKQLRCEEEKRYIQDQFMKEQESKTAKKRKSVSVKPFPSVDEFCDHYAKALYAEIEHLRNAGEKKQHIFNGKLISRSSTCVYSFESEFEITSPDGTEIHLWHRNERIDASIVGCEDFSVIIASTKYLGDEIPSMEFSTETWQLIEALKNRLYKLKDSWKSPIVQSLVCDGYNSIKRNTPIVTGQANACRLSFDQPITFIWGPPGTGKTETLANIALKHIAQNQRVLMLSYSNVSVDGAIMRVHKNDKNRKAGKLIRYGYPKSKELLQHEYLTSYNYAIHKHKDLLEERTNLNAERKKLSKSEERYVIIANRLSQIRDQLKEEEKSVVRSASFVATTVSKAVVDAVINSVKFDVVIFDEASMAYVPQIIFAASLAYKHFICMGDFSQLPPIVQSSSDSALNADIFQYCGITKAVEDGCGHRWLCMLNTQYRMHPQIADFASEYMYKKLLLSDESMEQNRRAISNSVPFCGQAIGLADISGMMSVCSSDNSGSHLNPLSAFISFALALKAKQDNDVGIITPYSAQSRLLHAMSRDLTEQHHELSPIPCATVHQFQGSEKSVIVYDCVDCFFQKHPGTPLASTTNNYANRLFNVALTRAKGKFVAVANVDYLLSRNFSSYLMFSKFINRYKGTSHLADGKTLDEELYDDSLPCLKWLHASDANELFLSDMSSAKKEVIINIPGKVGCDNAFLAKFCANIENLQQNGIRVIIRAEHKSALPQLLQKIAIENKSVLNPITLIDKKISWFGEPLSDAHFVSESTTIQTQYRPIIRFEGKYTATSLFGFLEMNNNVDQLSINEDTRDGAEYSTFASYITSNVLCKSCGKPMRLRKNKKGGFFIGCSRYPNCNTIEWISADILEDYFSSYGSVGKRCPQDNMSLEAVDGPYGVYVRCCSIKQHKFKLDEI